jgi:hypothetical protein
VVDGPRHLKLDLTWMDPTGYGTAPLAESQYSAVATSNSARWAWSGPRVQSSLTRSTRPYVASRRAASRAPALACPLCQNPRKKLVREPSPRGLFIPHADAQRHGPSRAQGQRGLRRDPCRVRALKPYATGGGRQDEKPFQQREGPAKAAARATTEGLICVPWHRLFALGPKAFGVERRRSGKVVRATLHAVDIKQDQRAPGPRRPPISVSRAASRTTVCAGG